MTSLASSAGCSPSKIPIIFNLPEWHCSQQGCFGPPGPAARSFARRRPAARVPQVRSCERFASCSPRSFLIAPEQTRLSAGVFRSARTGSPLPPPRRRAAPSRRRPLRSAAGLTFSNAVTVQLRECFAKESTSQEVGGPQPPAAEARSSLTSLACSAGCCPSKIQIAFNCA